MSRIIWTLSASLAMLFVGQAHVQAQTTCPPETLGVSRTIEVDATGGPRFGEPNGNRDLLAAGEVVLTFDDGPMPKYTRPILAALAAQCTKATFFNVGEMAAEYPDVVKEVLAQGHTISAHTWSHKNLARLSSEKMKAEIEIGMTAVEKAMGAPPAPFFRFPYLSESKAAIAYLQSRNIAMFATDIDSFDYRTRNPQTVVRRVMASLERRGRGIILFHDIHHSTAAALPILLLQLKAKGFKVVHLTQKAPAQTIAEYQPPAKEAAHRVAAEHQQASKRHSRGHHRRKSLPTG